MESKSNVSEATGKTQLKEQSKATSQDCENPRNIIGVRERRLLREIIMDWYKKGIPQLELEDIVAEITQEAIEEVKEQRKKMSELESAVNGLRKAISDLQNHDIKINFTIRDESHPGKLLRF